MEKRKVSRTWKLRLRLTIHRDRQVQAGDVMRHELDVSAKTLSGWQASDDTCRRYGRL